MKTTEQIAEIVGAAKHNAWQIRYAYWCGIGRAMIESGRVNPRDTAGKVWPCYESNTRGEILYSIVGQEAMRAIDGGDWSLLVGTREWAAERNPDGSRKSAQARAVAK